MHITLRANEKLYLNGAVLKPDRKVSIELMNDAVFLLEAHVIQERDATTPLRQLYYIVQLMLMSPHHVAANRAMFSVQHAAMVEAYDNRTILDALHRVATLVDKERHFEALKIIRSVLSVEDTVLNPVDKPLAPVEAPAMAAAS